MSRNCDKYEYDVSVVIVNWNTCDITRDCLRSVYEQTRDISFEVIVVDNASSDDSVQMIKKDFPQAILIENKENCGFAAANNQGMEIAKGRYFLLLNSDTVVLDGAIQKTVKYADDHPASGVVGCRVLNSDRSLQPTCFMFPSALNLFLSTTYLYKIFPENRFFGRETMGWWKRDSEMEVQTVTGCYMLVRKQAVDQVGVMDESYFMYAEETDWCCRFKDAGWQMLFTPDPEIIHLGGGSSKKMRPAMILQARASILLFIKNHRSYLEYLLSCLLFSLHALIRLPYWLIHYLLPTSDKNNDRERIVAYLRGSLLPLFGWKALKFKKN